MSYDSGVTSDMQIVIAVNEMDSKTMKPENSARYPAGYVSPHSTLHVLRAERYQRPWHSRHSRRSRRPCHPQYCVDTMSLILTTLAFSSFSSPFSPPILCQHYVVNLDNLGILVTLVTLVTLFTPNKVSTQCCHPR